MRQLVHYYSDFETFHEWSQINSIKDSNKLLIEINYPNDNRLEITILLNDLNEKFPKATIIGMQSFASYKNHQVTDFDKSPVISIMEFETSSISSVVLDIDTNYIKDAKEDYTIDIMEIERNLQPDTQAIQILSSYNTIHTSSLINNLGQIFSHLKIFGGGATNSSNYDTDTFVFHNNRIYNNAVILIFMNGENLDINLFQAFDWKPIGKKKKITKTENSSILTIEDSPALNIYKKYFPNIENNSSVFFQVPLYITKRNVSYSVHIQDMNKHSQCIQTAQQLEDGDTVQLSIGNYNDMMNRTEEIY
ncbi:MAG: hypothetical protein KAG56_01890, partial [Sulfurovaceae bacterium]|nr:hypothetical protein [Sulfurovaceae bacterium]